MVAFRTPGAREGVRECNVRVREKKVGGVDGEPCWLCLVVFLSDNAAARTSAVEKMKELKAGIRRTAG